MNLWEEYYKWYNNKNGLSWWDYYNLYVSKRWKRESKQRNYQRNNDIIYKNTNTKRNSYEIENELIPVKDGEFYIDGNILYLSYEDLGYKGTDSFTQYPVTVEVDDDLKLIASIRNGVTGTDFKIQSDGILVNDGTDEYELNGSYLAITDEILLRTIPIKKERIRPFNFITMEIDNDLNLVADIPTMILDADFKINNNGELTLNYG